MWGAPNRLMGAVDAGQTPKKNTAFFLWLGKKMSWKMGNGFEVSYLLNNSINKREKVLELILGVQAS
jgi:hypothetical protein